MSLELEKVKRIIEGALFAAGQPMKLDKLGALFLEEEAPPAEMLVDAITQLQDEYATKGVLLKEVSSGYRFQVQEDVAEWVSRLWEEKPARYSRALLETLALIAYRQPITRGEIEQIRGVSVSSHITKTLLEREWIRVVGHRDVPGRPAMYGTTRIFLDYFNLKNLDELPSLAEIRDLDTINAELALDESFDASVTQLSSAIDDANAAHKSAEAESETEVEAVVTEQSQEIAAEGEDSEMAIFEEVSSEETSTDTANNEGECLDQETSESKDSNVVDDADITAY